MFLSRYGPYVSFRRTFEWVRRRYVFLLASLAGYVVLFPLVLWFAMDTTPTAFKGFVGLDPATYRMTVTVVAVIALGMATLSVRRARSTFDVDELASDPSIDGDAALAERLRMGVLLQFMFASSIGTLATILWIANGGIVIPLAFLGSAAGLMFYARPRWQDWADVRDALWGRGAGWKGDGASE